jgi:serine/threonine-protein kinase
MTPLSQFEANWPAISALLDEALNLPPGGHVAWIAGLTGERAAHREALTALLARRAEGETDDFLVDGPRLSNVVDAPGGGLAEGAQIGAYRLISEIGRGGMGTVWLAERADGLMKRRVALKLPRAVWGDAFAERLEREREILASLEHEHIARLYDAGIDAQGRPFLAMEYVEGEPIDTYFRTCTLEIRARIVLLLQVMAAVSHAHARLVVHRDLKPGNILVTREGKVKLLDFGIAKLLEGDRTSRTTLTELSGRALTLNYASPEQIRGEPIGTASDIYSMGVVAYELLAQARPYRLKRGTAADVEEAIATVEPRLASDAAESKSARKVLRGDLDSILHRALKKNVAERYPSMEALAHDLERYLKGQPVQARPDSRRYRVAKFISRNRLPVAMTSALVASVLGGSAAALWQARVAHEQQAQAEAEVTRQTSVRDLYKEALMRLSVVRGDKADATDGVTAVLQDVFRMMAPRYVDQPEAQDAQLEAVMLQLQFNNQAEASIAVGHQYLDALKAHHAAAFRITDAYLAVGRNLGSLGRLDESEEVLRAGLAWSPDIHDLRTERSRLDLAADLARTLIARGKREEAEPVLMRTEAVAARVLPNDSSRFQNLMQLSIFWWVFDDARSLQYARQAHAGVVAAGTADQGDRALDLWYLGAAQSDNGLAKDAEATCRAMLSIFQDGEGKDSVMSIQSVGRVASALSRQENYTGAEALLSDEFKALSAMQGGISTFASRELRGRQLENAWLSGNVQSALAWVSSDAQQMLTEQNLRSNELLLVWHVRALELVGREREALSLLQALKRAWPTPDSPTRPWLRMLELEATLQLAIGEPSHARDTARGLLATLTLQRGSGGRAYRVAAELAALAAARLGDKADAAKSLALANAASPPPPFPSRVEFAESNLRRAEIFSVLGRATEAASAARTAMSDLGAQRAGSPRLTQAHRFAGTEAAVVR